MLHGAAAAKQLNLCQRPDNCHARLVFQLSAFKICGDREYRGASAKALGFQNLRRTANIGAPRQKKIKQACFFCSRLSKFAEDREYRGASAKKNQASLFFLLSAFKYLPFIDFLRKITIFYPALLQYFTAEYLYLYRPKNVYAHSRHLFACHRPHKTRKIGKPL